MRRVLMVAYHYPPEGSSSGVLRTLKFSKYLPRHGWAPHVLTLDGAFYTVRDEGLLRDIPPEVVVHRTRAVDTARHLSLYGRYPACLTVPDRFVGWLPFGVAKGVRVARRAGVQALYSTSPPATAHLIAAAVRRITGVPWVADFRDPWIEEGFYPPPASLRYRVESRLERAVVQWADRLTVTTPYLRGDFLGRYPRLAPDRVHVVYNGYDEADFTAMGPPQKGARFDIVHAGLVTPEYRDPRPLLEALAGLLCETRVPRSTLSVTFLGGGRYLRSADFTAIVRALGLEDVVHVQDRIPHGEVPARLRQTACLLLLQASDDTRSLVPAKAFEYLRVGRPILALVPDGATADLLKEMERCTIVAPSDPARLRDALAGLYREWRESSDPVWVARRVERFERATLTVELARILDELAPGAGDRPTARDGARAMGGVE